MRPLIRLEVRIKGQNYPNDRLGIGPRPLLFQAFRLYAFLPKVSAVTESSSQVTAIVK
jgi:hypothetical protein